MRKWIAAIEWKRTAGAAGRREIRERAMSYMSGKKALLELLRQEGVKHIFGNPGTTELPLMDELAAETDIQYVLGLQEAAVMAMADGYAQASGRLAAVNLHAAPGLGNALGMLYNAQKAGAPVLVTAGQHDQSFTITEPILWADLPTIARPFVKWSFEITRFEDLPRAVHRAAKVALTPPTGPVFLSIPGDVLTAEGDIDLAEPTRVAWRLQGDPEAIEFAAEIIGQAARPVLIAGDAVAQSGAVAELVELVELIGAPVYLEGLSSTASFPTAHPLCLGSLGRLAPTINQRLSEYDLLISIGGDLFTLSLPSSASALPEGMAVVHLDNDPWELGKNVPAKAAIHGDPKATLPLLTKSLRARLSSAQSAAIEARAGKARDAVTAARHKLRKRAEAEADLPTVNPTGLLDAVASVIPENVIVVEEGLSSTGEIREIIRSSQPNSHYGMRGGGIGWGLSAAVGIKLARPDQPVLCLTGDGSSLYTCQVLWTAAHHQLGGLVFMILNNGGYRIIKQRTRALRGYAAQTGRYVGMDLKEPEIDFMALARSFGVTGKRLTTLREVRDALPAALAANEPMVLEVAMDEQL
jgi:benzoylformate decarboxylase